MPKQVLPEDAPTQLVHPWQTSIRTGVQTLSGVIAAAFAFILLLGSLAPQLLDAIQDLLSPEVYAWAAGFVTTLVALSVAVTRLMAIPVVNEWLKRVKLGAPDK